MRSRSQEMAPKLCHGGSAKTKRHAAHICLFSGRLAIKIYLPALCETSSSAHLSVTSIKNVGLGGYGLGRSSSSYIRSQKGDSQWIWNDLCISKNEEMQFMSASALETWLPGYRDPIYWVMRELLLYTPFCGLN
jgi:hypothetical protein